MTDIALKRDISTKQLVMKTLINLYCFFLLQNTKEDKLNVSAVCVHIMNVSIGSKMTLDPIDFYCMVKKKRKDIFKKRPYFVF